VITVTQYRSMQRNVDGEIEKAIDGAIQSNAAFPAAHISVAVRSGWDFASVERVLSSYRSAGWKAEFVYDDRDGNFIKLEEK